jgi:hypothetical protein
MASALPIVDDVLGVVTIDMPVKNVVRLMSTSLENKNAIKRLFGDNFFRKLERVRIVSEAKKCLILILHYSKLHTVLDNLHHKIVILLKVL